MRDKGYFFTLIAVSLLLLILSMTLFYFQASKPRMNDIVTNIQTDELHYFVEAIKDDFGRAMVRSAWLAGAYAINQNEELAGYQFRPCTSFEYNDENATAAIAQLMLCGTFRDSDESMSTMGNSTFPNWTERVENFSSEAGFNLDLSLRNFSIVPYGSFHFAVIGVMDAVVRDRLNISFFVGNITAVSVVPIYVYQDPIYFHQTGYLDLMRNFSQCDIPAQVDGSIIDGWINGECYMPSNITYFGASFFDRLDGNLNTSDHYQEIADELSAKLGVEAISVIGIESIADITEFRDYGLETFAGNSWFDHLYWQDFPGFCNVSGMSNEDFRIDPEHALRYNIVGLGCNVYMFYDSLLPGDVIVPAEMTIPRDTWIRFVNNGTDLHILDVWDGASTKIVDGELISAGDSYSHYFDISDTYTYSCSGHLSPTGTITVAQTNLVPNSGFESGSGTTIDYWTDGSAVNDGGNDVEISTTEYKYGSQSVLLKSDGTYGTYDGTSYYFMSARQTVHLSPSTEYTLHWWIKGDNARAAAPKINEYTSAGGLIRQLYPTAKTGTFDWTYLTYTWTTDSQVDYILLQLLNRPLNGDGVSRSVWYDGILLRS